MTATPNAVTDANGITSVEAALGPVAATAQVGISVCAWTGVCAQFTGIGVGDQDLALVLDSGGQQTVAGTAVPAVLVAMVTDAAGHPVAAAPVSVYQTVTALDAACPATGRCPAASVLASQATVLLSGLDGKVTIVPLVESGMATRTEIATSTGTAGFATAVIDFRP
jgi:hypothetical protein